MTKKINPRLIDTLNELIGVDAACKLALMYGGLKYSFTGSDVCLARLTLIVGEEKARKLIATFYPEEVEIPMYKYMSKEKRNENIRADRDAGMSQPEIALKYEMTERGVRMILDKAD